MRGLIFAAAFVLSACSMSADTELAEKAVPRFHASLSAEQYESIYSEASEDLRRATTRESFVELLGGVRKKLGVVRSSAMQSWNVQYHTSGTFVTLNYATVYAEGEAIERFVYRLKGEQALLAGYHINSNALVMK